MSQGEGILHILNGVLNKPARDAKLLEMSMKGVGTRDDLLIARLIRIHWDPEHMQAVKEAYKEKYGMTLRERIQGDTSGDYQTFLVAMLSDRIGIKPLMWTGCGLLIAVSIPAFSLMRFGGAYPTKFGGVLLDECHRVRRTQCLVTQRVEHALERRRARERTDLGRHDGRKERGIEVLGDAIADVLAAGHPEEERRAVGLVLLHHVGERANELAHAALHHERFCASVPRPKAAPRIVRLRAEGWRFGEIAHRTGMHEGSVRRIFYDLARDLSVARRGSAPGLDRAE